MKAYLKQTRISSKKANLIAALVRNKKALEASELLKFTPKKAAPILRKLIDSALANAETNFKQNKDDLYIKEIIVTEGPTLKRSIPISKGRTHPILKRTAHITVKLESRAKTEEVAKPEKTAKAKPEEATKEEPAAKKAKEPKTKTEEAKK
jgi:large subunit ribosomal protein L22